MPPQQPDAAEPPIADAAIDVGPVCVTPGPPMACDALERVPYQGATPLGIVDLTTSTFSAADCITRAFAGVTLNAQDPCDAKLTINFNPPVDVGPDGKRRVIRDFDNELGAWTLERPGQAPQTVYAPIHVDVTTWQEGATEHTIDITISTTDPRFTTAPLPVRGTFCTWSTLLCAAAPE